MKTRILIVALLTTLLGADGATASPLTIMSFNVRYGTADDGPNAWEHRKDILIRTIQKCNPDILGTQECLDFQARYIVKALPQYAWFGVGRERDGSGENVAIFYKKNAFTPLKTGRFWLSRTPDVPGSKDWGSHSVRMAMWVQFQPKRDGAEKPFYFFNTHLDNGSEEARRQAARLLADRITHLPPDTPVILTGDFNDDAQTSQPWRILTAAKMNDCWLAAHRRIGPPATWGAFQPPNPNDQSRIDWILTRGSVTVLSCETVLYNEHGHYPSDHYPVCAKIAFKPSPSRGS